jgi:predicted transcriptional regulator of viral defense system
VVQRFGWLADRIGIPFPDDARSALKRLVSKHRTYLDASNPIVNVRFDREWRIWVNVTDHQLSADTPLKSRI